MGGGPVSELFRAAIWVPPTGDLESDERGRFLSALVLIYLPVASLVGLVGLPLWQAPDAPLSASTFWATAGSVLTLPLVYVLNRRGHRLLAAGLLVAGITIAVVWVSRDEPILLTFLTVIALLSAALFPLKAVAWIAGVILLVHPALLLLPDPNAPALQLALCLNVAFLGMGAVVHLHDRRLESYRLAEIRRSQQWFATTLSSIGDAVLTTDPSQKVTFMNPVAEQLTGWSFATARGRLVGEVFNVVSELTGESADNPVTKVLRSRSVVELANHTTLVAKDGTRRPIADSGAPIEDSGGEVHGVVLVFRDLTEKQALEAQLRHSQRLDALGQLAGGVAHDFNNLLTVMGGSAELALACLPPSHECRQHIEEVLEATRRAVGVTSQLLAFSRRQVMKVQVVALNDALLRSQQLLRRLLTESVQLIYEPDTAGCCVSVDPEQLEQVIMNLAINARDAMPEGGRLTLSAASVVVTDDDPIPPLSPGRYGRLRVTDTGMGIEPSALQHIFEPFFTTKERGRGTGLGLSTVYGIVQQSGGTVRVEATSSKGTSFDVLLPAVDAPFATAKAPCDPALPVSKLGTQTILLAEDDDMLRGLATRALNRLGYRVIEAQNGSDALVHLNNMDISLVITDIVMPGVGGAEVARRFRDSRPNLPVLFISGYADDIMARSGVTEAGESFLGKPFSLAALQAAVDKALSLGSHSTTHSN
jgi:two-component system cell cycle sensor histidine kinase/response regulator CckA